MYKGKKVIFTITACCRPDMLQTTIRSFAAFCQDMDVIDEIYYLDDSSKASDRTMAIDAFKQIFNKPIIFKFAEKESFPDKNRHARMLNIWRHCISEAGADYIFHTEDDFKFYNHFTIGETIDIMENNTEYAYMGFGYSWKNFPKDMMPKKIIGNFWETVYFEDRPLNDLLFLDEAGAVQNGGNQWRFWMYYLNWPYFSLRPGVHHAKKLLSVGEFLVSNDKNISMELEFSIRWTKLGYKSMMYKHFCAQHIGNISAYELNQSSR